MILVISVCIAAKLREQKFYGEHILKAYASQLQWHIKVICLAGFCVCWVTVVKLSPEKVKVLLANFFLFSCLRVNMVVELCQSLGSKQSTVYCLITVTGKR